MEARCARYLAVGAVPLTSVNAHVFDIDLFDADQSAISKLHRYVHNISCDVVC